MSNLPTDCAGARATRADMARGRYAAREGLGCARCGAALDAPERSDFCEPCDRVNAERDAAALAAAEGR